MIRRRIIILSIIISAVFFTALSMAAEDAGVNEKDLFSSPDTVLDSKSYEKKGIDADQNRKRLSVSGELTSVNAYTAMRESLKNRDHTGNQLNPYIDGVLFADIRLPSNVKGFGNFELKYNARLDTTDVFARELFVDFNIANAIYFRTGKQVLQWGRCYLWNPTDLINVEKKIFEQKIGSREGAYGIKAHVPFGTVVNLYGFLDTKKTEDADGVGGAGKLEFVLGKSEMALSIWDKKTYHPVYGYDFSSRVFLVDIVGEASASNGSNMDRVVEHNRILTTERESGRWIYKGSINFGHAFDVGDQKDKIQLNMEFFYNGDGYSKDFIKDETLYFYDRPVTIKKDGKDITLPAGIKAYYLLGNNLFEPNYHSRYYGALFTTINKFIRSELSLVINLIGNIEQKSFILMTGINYANINDLKAGLIIYSYLGKSNTEYTFNKVGLNAVLTVGIVF